MTRMVFCKRFKKELPGLESPPLPGPAGEEIFENSSKRAWEEWQKLQVMLINEKHLNLREKESRKYITVNEYFSQVKSIIFTNSRHLKEENKKFGKLNGDITFYVIRRTPPGAGLFSNYLLVLMHLKYAELNNLTPVIDYKNYSNYYSGKSHSTSENYWDNYWDQPTKYNLDEVYQSSNVILSSANISKLLEKNYGYYDLNSKKFLENQRQINDFNGISNSIKLRSSVEEKVNNDLKSIFASKQNILGISLRGTDYLNTNLAKGHYKPLNIDEAILLTEKKLVEWKMDYIFVCTEVKEYIELFVQRFGEKALFLRRQRFSNSQSEKFITQYRFKRNNDSFETGLEYLREVYLFSKCDSIIGTVSGGFNSATILNDKKFQNFKIMDKGLI